MRKVTLSIDLDKILPDYKEFFEDCDIIDPEDLFGDSYATEFMSYAGSRLVWAISDALKHKKNVANDITEDVLQFLQENKEVSKLSRDRDGILSAVSKRAKEIEKEGVELSKAFGVAMNEFKPQMEEAETKLKEAKKAAK